MDARDASPFRVLTDTDTSIASWQRVDELIAHPDGVLRANLVASVNGMITGPDGTSSTLTGGSDRLLLKRLRREADVLLLGAETLRAEPAMLPGAIDTAVLTRTGDLGSARPRAGRRLLVLTPVQHTTLVSERLARAGHDGDTVVVPLRASIRATIFAEGYRRPLCEGGAGLIAQLLDDEELDELCLTTAPLLAPAGVRLPAAPTLASLELSSLMCDGAGFSYARFARGTRREMSSKKAVSVDS